MNETTGAHDCLRELPKFDIAFRIMTDSQWLFERGVYTKFKAVG